MKKIVIALIVAICLIGCGLKEKENKEDLIKIYEEEGLSFYIATPSGTLYYATDSEPIVYVGENGETRNIYEDNELHR